MVSILLILVITIIAFVSLADFVQFCTEPLVLQSTFHQYGICNKKAGAKAAKGYSPQTVVFASERVSGFDSEPNPKPQAAPSETPFEGSYIPCPTIQSDGDFQFASMEMPPVQANLFGKTRMLCSMRSALESLLGPRLCGTSPQAVAKTSSVETRPLEYGGRLASRPMDSVTAQTPIPEEEIQEACCMEQCPQRQRSRKPCRNPAKLWTTAFTGYAIAGATMVGWDGALGNHQFCCPSPCSQPRTQGGQREREEYEISGCRTPKMQGRLARGSAIFGEGSDNPEWTGRDQVPTFRGITTRQSQERIAGSPDSTSGHACRMEKLLGPISGPMVQIHRAIHAAGASNDGQAQDGPRKSDGRKRQPWCLQGVRRPGHQGRRIDDERCRGLGSQAHRNLCRAENSSELSGLGIQPTNTTQASRTSCAARSRARPNAQETTHDSPRAVSRWQCRRWKVPVFWGARVNTFTPSIAQGHPNVMRSHGDNQTCNAYSSSVGPMKQPCLRMMRYHGVSLT